MEIIALCPVVMTTVQHGGTVIVVSGSSLSPKAKLRKIKHEMLTKSHKHNLWTPNPNPTWNNLVIFYETEQCHPFTRCNVDDVTYLRPICQQPPVIPGAQWPKSWEGGQFEVLGSVLLLLLRHGDCVVHIKLKKMGPCNTPCGTPAAQVVCFKQSPVSLFTNHRCCLPCFLKEELCVALLSCEDASCLPHTANQQLPNGSTGATSGERHLLEVDRWKKRCMQRCPLPPHRWLRQSSITDQTEYSPATLAHVSMPGEAQVVPDVSAWLWWTLGSPS